MKISEIQIGSQYRMANNKNLFGMPAFWKAAWQAWDIEPLMKELSEMGSIDPEIFDYTNRVQNLRLNGKYKAEAAAYASEHPNLANAKTVFTRPHNALLSILSTAGNWFHNAFSDEYRPVDPNSVYHHGTQANQAVRSATRNNLQRDGIWVNPLSQNKIAAEVYDGTMMAADSLFEYVCGAFGEFPGLSAAVGAVGTAGESVEDSLLRGGDSGQALKSGTVNGLLDFALSYLLMDKLGKIKGGRAVKGGEAFKKSGSKIKDIGQVIGLNALQSAGGQVAREAADSAIMGDKSRRAIRLRELMEQGYTEEEANKILIEQDIRAMASIAPIVAGGVQYGAARAMRAASDIDDIVRRHEYGDEADPSFTDTDMALAEILQEDAPRKPFTDEADGGIVEGDKKAPDFDSTAEEAHYQNLDAYKNIDPELFRELETSGVKYTAEDVITLCKNHEGKLLWLEKGNHSAGLEHILKHTEDFASQGIQKNQIVDFIITAIRDGKIVGYQCRGQGRPIYEVDYNGKTYRVAVTVGSNGFIVGANPQSRKK